MSYKRIIPCLDVKDGRVVKGTNFIDLKDAGDPVELAKRYNDQGADELVFLDITASSDKRKIMIDMVEKTAKDVFIPLTVGGGINDIETIQALLESGADKVSINTAAVKNPDFVSEASAYFGSQCIVAAIDAKQITQASNLTPDHIPQHLHCDAQSSWEIFTHGGRTPTGIDAVKWANHLCKLGAGELLVTSMDRDGTKKGYDLTLLKALKETCSCPIIASGGAGELKHIIEALHCVEAALLASLLHFKELELPDIKTALLNHDIPARQSK